MKQHLSNLFTFFLFVAALLSFTSGYGADNLKQKRFLNDSIIAAQPDTGHYLTLPLIVRQDSVPMVPNDLIRDRLSCLQGTIPLHYNSYVQGFVNYFTIRNRRYTRRILERENVYFPLFEKHLAQHNLPQELKYLAVVESALNPKAVSWAKAVGLWQFMSPTARDFRLEINNYIDERMDPEKSTEAACKFLKQLYRIFGDWELVLAAYNCGPGNVRKAIARAGGGKKTFWEIFPYLPKETRSYVPSFTAVVYAMNYSLDHEIVPDTLLFAVATDTVIVNHSLDLQKLSLQLALGPEEIKKLNPEVKQGVLPETIRNYPLKVPALKREIIAMNRTAILDSCKVPVLVKPAPETMLASSTSVKKPAVPQPADSARTDSLVKTEYVVVRGDFLQKIAQKHQVTIAQVKEWNNLENATIMPGQKLVIYLAAEAKTEASPEAEKVAEEKIEKTAARTLASTKSVKEDKVNKAVEEVQLIHAVQPGDTLYNISKRYNNIPVERIKKINKLKSNDIKPGQKLVIS